MSNIKAKLGKKEEVVRSDGATNVWQFMIDPTLTVEELEAYKKIEYVPARWVLVDVIPVPKSLQ